MGERAADEEREYAAAYNAHEWAEQAALAAIGDHLRHAPLAALMCLSDREWHWTTRGAMSGVIVDLADEILTERLDEMVGAEQNGFDPVIEPVYDVDGITLY